MKQFLIVPDIHVPFHDLKYIDFITRLLKYLKTQGNLSGIIQLGDALDFFQVSSYPKDPARRNSIKDDLDDYLGIVNLWSSLLPKNAIYHQLEGNHEYRLQKYIANNAKEIYELVESVKSYLSARFKSKNHSFVWHQYRKWNSLKIGDVTIFHGFYYNQHTAATNLAKYKTSVICGHTHRLQMISDGAHYSATLGHGSDEKETAHQPTPSGWQQACGVLNVNGMKTSLEIVTVNDGKGIYAGKTI